MQKSMKLQIAEQLNELAKEKRNDKLTVTDLVEKCKISRQTFYYHFRDIPDVIDWYINKDIDDKLRLSIDEGLKIGTVRTFVDVLMNCEPIIQYGMATSRMWRVDDILVATLRRVLKKLLQAENPGRDLNTPETKLHLDFSAYGVSGAIYQNMLTVKQDPDLLAKEIYAILTSMRSIQLN
ncbi:MAG: hypothetical protein K5682_02260 [Lachnospiraceae bacterium]|nr:hypothetical protein [Lachnospiraceae bacterium]